MEQVERMERGADGAEDADPSRNENLLWNLLPDLLRSAPKSSLWLKTQKLKLRCWGLKKTVLFAVIGNDIHIYNISA